MSSKLRWASLTGLLVVIVIVGLVAGFASASTSSGRIYTLRVITDKPHTETLDFPPKGKSPGEHRHLQRRPGNGHHEAADQHSLSAGVQADVLTER